jgi:hypothetical protein
MLRPVATFWRYVRIQLIVFVFGIVEPIFLIIFFATQPDPSTKWAYWAGLFITAAEVLIALAITMPATRRNLLLMSASHWPSPSVGGPAAAINRAHRTPTTRFRQPPFRSRRATLARHLMTTRRAIPAHRRRVTSYRYILSAATTASAKACGASCGTLCPMPSRIRCA